jgi:ABC-type sugar transport system substrate-binding protein
MWIDRKVSTPREAYQVAAAISLLGLVYVLGCSKENAANTQKIQSGSPNKTAFAAIGFQEDQFFKLAQSGMKASADKAGVELLTGSSAGSMDKEITLVDTYIAQKVSAIVIAPLNTKASAAALKRAHDAGIKIVTYDNAVEADFPESTIKSDPILLGRPTGEAAKKYIEAKLGGKAKIAVITYISLLPEAASQRNKGFLDEVKKLPGVKIVAQQDAWMAPEAVGVVETILTAHPDLDLIWAANEGGTVGAVTAVKNAGKAGKVRVFGTDISEQIADFLLAPDDILQAVTGQKPFEIGSMAVETAAKAVKGEKVEKKVNLPGAFFSRELPDEVRKYKQHLAELVK